jgi:hypothetical protein
LPGSFVDAERAISQLGKNLKKRHGHIRWMVMGDCSQTHRSDERRSFAMSHGMAHANPLPRPPL